jgi:hypothetical protein
VTGVRKEVIRFPAVPAIFLLHPKNEVRIGSGYRSLHGQAAHHGYDLALGDTSWARDRWRFSASGKFQRRCVQNDSPEGGIDTPEGGIDTNDKLAARYPLPSEPGNFGVNRRRNCGELVAENQHREMSWAFLH